MIMPATRGTHDLLLDFTPHLLGVVVYHRKVVLVQNFFSTAATMDAAAYTTSQDVNLAALDILSLI